MLKSMNIIDTLIRLRDDLKEWVTNNILELKESIPSTNGLATEEYVDEKLEDIELPTKTSQLMNDSGFLTQIPNEYITETELNAKGYLTEHQDISGLATKEYVNNAITNLNIDIDYDSLLAFDTTEIIREPNYVDNDNNLILDDLPVGIYTLKYEFEDGTYTDIKNFTIKNESSGAVMNLLEEGEIYLNKIFDRGNVSLKDYTGVVTIALPIDFDGKTLRNTTLFARLQTAGGMRSRKTLAFLAFFSSNR